MFNSDDESSTAKYSKTTINLTLKKDKQKAHAKAYRNKLKNLKNHVDIQLKKNTEKEQVKEIETEFITIDMNINNNLSDSSSSLLSPSVDRHSSSESSFFDCQSSCNTSILDELDELDEEFTSIETLLPLYEHSTTYYDSFVQSFSELVLKHKLSDEAANDFLSLTKSVLPTPNNVPKNIKKIYNDILKNRNQYVHPFYYCKNC